MGDLISLGSNQEDFLGRGLQDLQYLRWYAFIATRRGIMLEIAMQRRQYVIIVVSRDIASSNVQILLWRHPLLGMLHPEGEVQGVVIAREEVRSVILHSRITRAKYLPSRIRMHMLHLMW